MENIKQVHRKKQQKKLFKKYSVLFFILASNLLSFEIKSVHKSQLFNNISERFKSDDFFVKGNEKCNDLDPIYMMGQRLQKPPILICQNEISQHICYQSSKYNHHNKLYKFPNGVICLMKNFTLDPSKSQKSNLIYKGPIDKISRGSAVLSKGFFSMKCKRKKKFKKYSNLYRNYFDSWDYDGKEVKKELEELAPGKIIFFISRNQDSPNLFHGLSELINTLSIMYLFNLNPEDIQIIFLESMILKSEPIYDLYINLISRKNNPIYIRNLKKKYYISSAINIPVAGDSPLFMFIKSPDCKYSIKTYKIINNLINKYLNIPIFNDTFISDNEIFYYPKSIINNYKLNKKFNKIVTIQWRKVWPKGRRNQKRILGNGPELAEILSKNLPNNILVRLVDSAALQIIQQISIMRNTNYFIGVHGAGLSLSIFMPNTSILHEILPYKRNQLLLLMSKLSGHKSYSDILKNKIKIIDENEYIFFDEKAFIKSVLKHMKQNHLIS